MKTREITDDEKKHAKVSGSDVDVYPIISLDGKTYIQVQQVNISHNPQTIMVIDVTDEKDDVLVNKFGEAYVAMGEGRYVLVLTGCSWSKTDWGQYIPSDLFVKVVPLHGVEMRDEVSKWLESQYDN